MKEFWNLVRACFAGIGGWLGHFLGGNDGLLIALLAFVAADYITGVMCAIVDKNFRVKWVFVAFSRRCLFSFWSVSVVCSTQIS